jgi:hypothetical protein
VLSSGILCQPAAFLPHSVAGLAAKDLYCAYFGFVPNESAFRDQQAEALESTLGDSSNGSLRDASLEEN